MPQEVYDNYRARDIKIAYKKETTVGDDLTIKLYQRNESDCLEIFCIIEKEGQTACEIYTKWIKGGVAS